jgi:hypothetical protein
MQFEEVLRTWSAWFEHEGIQYAVAGGNALRAFGHQRATYDVDFVISGADRRRVIAFAESLGYETAHESAGYSNHYHPDETFGHVDLMFVYGNTAEQVFAGAVRRSLTGIELPVVRPEHLIAMKVRAMKNSPMRVHRRSGHRLPARSAGSRPCAGAGVLFRARAVEDLR